MFGHLVEDVLATGILRGQLFVGMSDEKVSLASHPRIPQYVLRNWVDQESRMVAV